MARLIKSSKHVAVVNANVDLPKNCIDYSSIKKDLTVSIRDQDGNVDQIRLYKETDEYISVPRKYGMEVVETIGLEYIDNTANGFLFSDKTKQIKLYEYQKAAVKEILDKFQTKMDVMFKAATGKGKTIMSLKVIQELNTTALIVVDQDNIKQQWIDRICQYYGIPKDRIGIIQGQIIDYEDKDIVIGMVQTLYKKNLPDSIYSYFGIMVVDECHILSSEKFSNVCNRFSATYRLGLSATPRNDQYRKIIESHIGKPEVVLDHKHEESSIRFVTYDGVISWYSNISPKSGRYVTEISEDTERNWLLANIIKKLYDSNREILVVSDRIEQLENILCMCKYIGIEESVMGIITGFITEWRYCKDITPLRKPEFLEPRTEYTPISLQRVRKRVNKKLKKEYHTKVQEESRIKFATYSIFGKAIDVPSLDAGVDCTPRAKVEQVHGRILRKQDNKLKPLWITIRDRMSYKAEYQFCKRLIDYRKSNAEIYEWDMQKGVRRITEVSSFINQIKERIEWLKTLTNIKTPDGNNTLLIEPTEKQLKPGQRNNTGRVKTGRKIY